MACKASTCIQLVYDLFGVGKPKAQCRSVGYVTIVDPFGTSKMVPRTSHCVAIIDYNCIELLVSSAQGLCCRCILDIISKDYEISLTGALFCDQIQQLGPRNTFLRHIEAK